ncbi:MAG: hypothetical protein P8I47_05190 [Schleiferiaceae bacterium]|nr:hypothetical protein [Schleiferiaceae bacterium]MDG1313475.1 hypothetical protein [Schleiferiaceae bacterium]MDG1918781.1 hypothetical protein [Schleiferiaceae bacterium]MDG2109913.1 hypothetical protein [Schleiferiaceae bacterium]
MNRKELVIALLSGVMLFVVAMIRPVQYAAEATFFVPLTLLEKQIEQNGIGFGSPTEVDAHIELMQSPVVLKTMEQRYDESFSLSVRKTRNGAVAVEVRSAAADLSATIANHAVAVADSIKQSMLRQNVGMSFDVMAERKFKLQAEERILRIALDSLRFAAQSDSLAYVALIFRKERQYGTAVVELTNVERKLEELKSYTDGPAPKSYSISPAMPVEKPVGLPAWVIGILGAVLVAVGLKVWTASTS